MKTLSTLRRIWAKAVRGPQVSAEELDMPDPKNNIAIAKVLDENITEEIQQDPDNKADNINK